MGGSKFLVCTRNANQATKLMVAEGFRLNHQKVAVEAVGPPVTVIGSCANTAACAGCVLGAATTATRPPRAVSWPYCKRCGVFGHDTEGCVEECKRCGGHHGTRDCSRRRSYVAAARGFPSASDPPPNSDQSSESALSKASASTSGLQVLKPKSPLPTNKKTPNYWDGDKTEENDARSAATSSLTHQRDQRDGSEDTASVTSDSDLAICTSESSSAEPSPNSSPSPTSSDEEQAVPTFAASLEAATTESPHANSESLAQPPLGSSRVASLEDAPIVSCGRYVIPPEHAYVIPASDPGPSRQALVDSRTEAAPPTGLSQRHRSRSRRGQGDRDGSEQKERAGSTENNLRRSKTAVVSSDSDAAWRAQSKKPRKGSLGDGSPPPREDPKS
ncbi:hypothetical protein HPB50_007677 [Hyalomma asiaticum]|uniref:Uncharacterized protein n=1 Tax=Hyalomma asiaticum TaxID=266040 RepID=A0ACB7TK78_HYAAI|nr:hypothetical protein HPB50_007677 [Hyalomma asiaticum]